MNIGQFTLLGHSSELMFVVVKNKILTMKDFRIMIPHFDKFNSDKYSFTWRES